MDSLLKVNDGIYYYFLIGGLFLSYLIYRIINSVFGDNNYIQTNLRLRGHSWRSIECNKSLPYNIYCTVCGKLMLPLVGLFCECCALSACKRCHGAIGKKIRCKPITWPTDKPFYHHWVNVGIPRGDDSIDNIEDCIKKFFCSWCQRTKICPENSLNESEVCDFQKYKNIIIPPPCVQVEKGEIRSIKPLQDKNWEPLIIFANRKSGSNRSDEVLSIFKGLLNPIQVVDISSTPPESVLKWLPSRCRVLVAGGDGTVAWILNTLLMTSHVKAAVGILPMGTGNDLSRVLGWGATCGSHLDAHSIVTSLRHAQEQPLDRWKITIKPKRRRLGRLRPDRVLYAYNYASIGVDAQVALDFHRARTQFLYRYASRTLNYMAYAFLGAGRALDAGRCDALERRLRVRADGAALALPPLQALVALNIPSWGAGVDLWRLGNEGEVPEQSLNDGKLEVVGISSSFHIARLQCGLAEPYRFTQASKLTIDMDGSCAMQVDGEPWMQGPAVIIIEHAGQSLMLRSNTNEAD
ncbi:diacylglycerol kinase epsilon isoform X1 [Amyelois transitella]|uniref:diacylglycerol kinase epsilon isoform X1 n=2 Tax=Amyelois transitella TaxID=680683 RepID=UPI002990793C|nr:diacylglycerol kinase epsilon isoform X1 [Amyelois transitella]